MRPLVSVITLTYNQAEFLTQCLASVQAQTGDFDLEHIVVDDASTDGTFEILEGYSRQNPESKRILRHDSNRGANAGMAEAYGIARGDYVATCEGDDWWLAPDKVATQVDLMQRRPDLAMCFHDAVVVHEGRSHWPVVRPGGGDSIRTLDQLLVDNFAHTCTVMYRRIPDLEYPDWYTGYRVGDWPNHAFHAATGRIGYISRPLAAYRVHSKGSWSAVAEKERCEEICRMLEELDTHFLFRHHERISSTIERIRADATPSTVS